MVNSHLPEVNTHLPFARYGFATMAKTKGKRRGSRKGETKPFRRPLDSGYPGRLLHAMRRAGYVRPDGTTRNADLATKVSCERATIGQHLSTSQPKKSIDAMLLLDLCDALWVTPYWLAKNEGTIEDVEKNKLPMEEFRRKKLRSTHKTTEERRSEIDATGARSHRDAERA